MQRNILVTGGSRGIGQAIAACLRGYGHNVYTPTRKELDLSSDNSINNYFSSQSVEFDVLINNAGINIIGKIEELEQSSIDAMLSTNLVAPLLLIKNVVSSMKKRSFGRILNISSIWGVRSKEFRTLYSATKFGINGITHSLARELGPYGILINALAPGYVNTEMTKQNVSDEERLEIVKDIPLRRFAEPEDIAEVAAFLVSDNNRYMTGQTIIADGGFLA